VDDLQIGVLLDEPQILPGFDYVFYEAKPASGRLRAPLLKAWNVVNCFADNTISQEKPNLVATSKGERAIRGTPRRFLWDWICPTRSDYREYCKGIIREIAARDVAGVRLDSVCYPREGYCDCQVCSEEHRKSGQDIVEWRANQIESFLKDVRELVPHNLGLTIEPDPCAGKERFGLDLERVQDYVDLISTPLYMDYSIVYWLDIIANCIRRRIKKPYFIELYVGPPKMSIKNLVSALAVASTYCDTVVLSAYQAKTALRLQRELVGKHEVRKFFEERDCFHMLDILDRWEKVLT